VIGFTARRLMELEFEELTGAARAGTVELRIPSCVREATSKSSWRHASWPKRLRWCRRRNALAHAGRQGRRVWSGRKVLCF